MSKSKKKPVKKKKKAVPKKVQELRYSRTLLSSRLYRLRKNIMGAEDKELPAIKKTIKKTVTELKTVRKKLAVHTFANTKAGQKIKKERASLYAKRSRLVNLRDKKLRGRKTKITKTERAKLNKEIAKLTVRIAALNGKLQLKRKPKKKKKKKEPSVKTAGQWLIHIMPYWLGDEELRFALKRSVFKTYIIDGKRLLKKSISDIKYYFGKFIDQCVMKKASESPVLIKVSKSYKSKTIMFDFYDENEQ